MGGKRLELYRLGAQALLNVPRSDFEKVYTFAYQNHLIRTYKNHGFGSQW